MWQQARAHLSDNWPIYRLGLCGVASAFVLWGAFELVRQNFKLLGLDRVDPAVLTLGWMICLLACYGYFANRIMLEVKRQQGREK